MKLYIIWAGHKCVDNKDYFWGLIEDQKIRKINYTLSRPRYTFEIEKENVKISEVELRGINLHSVVEDKVSIGYSRITQENIEEMWPWILSEIEMEFTVRRLRDA